MTSLFHEAWARRRETPLAVSADVIGYIGLDVPTELVRAAGCAPVRIIASARHDGADDYAEGLGNPTLRGLAVALLEGPYRGLSKLIVSPTPAAYGWLYTFLREARPAGLEVVLFDLNHGTAPGLEAVRRRSVESLARRLSDWTGRTLASEAAIAEANATRTVLQRIEALRAEGGLTGADALAVHGAAEAMAPAAYQAALATVTGRAVDGRPVIYSGVETVDAAAYEALAASGFQVVGDDQDLGSRALLDPIAETGDPLAALAEAYAGRPTAPAKSSLEARILWLAGLVSRQQARGVAFAASPYDHPAGWETPAIRAALAAEGLEVFDV